MWNRKDDNHNVVCCQGAGSISGLPFVESFGKDISSIVLQHHERLDGTGYPNGIGEEEIDPETKIISVADVVEAMLSHRPYRAAVGMEETKAIIKEGKGRFYSPECVDACLELIEEHHNDVHRVFDNLAGLTGNPI